MSSEERIELLELTQATRTLVEDVQRRGKISEVRNRIAKPSSPSGEPKTSRTLEQVREELGDCKRCKLHAGRTKLVFGVGSASAELVFVGEGPGRDEDLKGEPFVGRAGQLLTDIIGAIGLTREEVYICNVVKCRPPENRNPEPDEVAACAPFLVGQIEAIRPKLICVLGKVAAQTLLQVETPISKIRGTFLEWHGIPVMPTYHPAYLLRNPSAKKDVWEDMKKLHAELCARTGREIPRKGK